MLMSSRVNMSCFKLQVLPLSCWKYPAQLLMPCTRFGSRSSSNLCKISQQRFRAMRDVQGFRLVHCWEHALRNICTTSVDLQVNGISQTEKKYFTNNLTDNLHGHISVRHIVSHIGLCPLHRVTASHGVTLASESLQHQVTARHAVAQMSTQHQHQVTARDAVAQMSTQHQHQVTARDAVTQMSIHQDTATHEISPKSKLHQVTDGLMVSQTSPPCSCWWQSTQHLGSTFVSSKKHFLQAQSFEVRSNTCPVCINHFSLYSILGFKVVVRFYSGQAIKSVKLVKDSREKYGDLNPSSEKSTDNNSESNRPAPVTIRTDVADPRNMDVTPEAKDDRDITDQGGITERKKDVDGLTLPDLSRTSFNIVPYVTRSVTLQNLVRLGVNLDKVQRVAGIAEHLVKSDFERDILPLVKFLVRVGVEAETISYVFTANPLLFLESVKVLELRVGYLLHQKFSLPDISSIISRAPIALLMDPVMLDEKLGFLQDVFGLTVNEVREVVKLYPKILPRKKELLAEMKFHLHEFIGFTNFEIKQLILKDPRIFVSGKGTLVSRFNYLHNYMQISHDQILMWPKILRMREYIVKNRHLFLLSLAQAQYDPLKEMYVSMQALALGTDEEFCRNVAKCPVQKFYDFCKTL